jgi:hypothetical protein
VYRWWERDTNGKPVRKKLQIGDADAYPTESSAHAAADALRLTINNLDTGLQHLQKMTVRALWELSDVKHSFRSTTFKNPQTSAVVEAVVKVGIQRPLLDFQEWWESPGFGLFHHAAFSTAFGPPRFRNFAQLTSPFSASFAWLQARVPILLGLLHAVTRDIQLQDHAVMH